MNNPLEALLKFTDSNAARGVILSAVLAITGFVVDQKTQAFRAQQKLDDHTIQLDRLEASSKASEARQQLLELSVSRVEGKIDVLNQKIDDDRAARHAAEHASGIVASR